MTELTKRYNDAIVFFDKNLDNLEVIVGRPSKYKGEKIPVSGFEMELILSNLTTKRTDKKIIANLYARLNK